jgi:hypothetical protein
VVVNVSSLRSDAILIKSSGHIDYVPLPLLTPEALLEKVEQFGALQELRMARPDGADSVSPTSDTATSVGADSVSASPDTASPDGTGAAPDAERALLDILEWLWDVVARPALDALHFDGRPNPWGLYEVKWVLGGPLGQLPIHAAGRHREAVTPDGDGRQPPTVMDRVISSYAPTVRALYRAHSRALELWRERPARSLVVAMPVGSTPTALYAAGEAARQLHDALPGATLLMPSPCPEGIDPALVAGEPSRDRVLDALNDCAIAHFLCHGVTDPVDPSRSRLLLSAGHRDDQLTVSELARVRLGSARLAYLSACSTARNEVTKLADESIHLAAALHLAGFPHVVGTLWEVDAPVATAVGREFYRRLAADREFPDVNRTATVLHDITRDLRADDPEAPFAWAAYLHVGR